MKPFPIQIYPLIALLLVAGRAHTQVTVSNQIITKTKEATMSTTQRNKEVIRTLFEQSLNKRNMGLLRNLVSEDYVGPGGATGVAAFEEPVATLIKAFPDIQWKVEELIAEGDKVVIRWTWQGTHTGQFQHVTATGKTITSTAIAMYELKAGKITHAQLQTDRLGFLQALEVLPLDVTKLSPKKALKGQVSFIDQFFVPAEAIVAFHERMQTNRKFIKTLPGFMDDTVYEHTDEKGNLLCLTIATWESKKAVEEAKAAVQAEYNRQGFSMSEMLERLGITLQRAIYNEMEGD